MDAPLPRADERVPARTFDDSFWQRSATNTAILLTGAMYAVPLLRALILWEPPDREALANAVEPCLYTWLAAAGIHKIGPTGRRRRE